MRLIIWGLQTVAAFVVYHLLVRSPLQDALFFTWQDRLLALGILCLLAAVPVAALTQLASRLEKWRRRWLTEARDQEAERLLPVWLSEGPEPRPTFFLYLRPFSTTGRMMITNPDREYANAAMPGAYAEETIEAESRLRDVLDPFGTLVALGRPGEHYGASRVATSDEEWRLVFTRLSELAELIFVVPSSTESTAWEIQQLRQRGLLAKTIFVMPPESVDRGIDIGERWQAARAGLSPDGIELPTFNPSGALFSHSGAHRTAMENWLRLKPRKLRRRLKSLCSELGVTLRRRPLAGRRLDSPPPAPAMWAFAFPLLVPNLLVGSGSVWSQPSQAWAWGTITMTVGLFFFLFWEAYYTIPDRRSLALLALVVAVVNSPVTLLPLTDWTLRLEAGQPWVDLLLRGALAGVVVVALFHFVSKRPAGKWMLTVPVLGSLAFLAGHLPLWLENLVGRWVGLDLGLWSITNIVTGAAFGLALPRLLGWRERVPDPARPSMGIAPFFVSWWMAGWILSYLEWPSVHFPLLWPLAGLLAGVAETVGHQRLGLLPRWPRVGALLAGWTLAGALAWYAGLGLESWLNPSVIAPGKWLDSSPTATGVFWVTALRGFLLFGVGAGLSFYLLADRGESAAPASWRWASRLAWPLLFAAVCGLSAAGHTGWQDSFYSAPVREGVTGFPLSLALAATAAGYLGRGPAAGSRSRNAMKNTGLGPA